MLEPDEGREGCYTVLCRGIIECLISLAVFTILQLWVHEDAEPPSWEDLMGRMLNLDFKEELPLTDAGGNIIKPDLAIRGIPPGDVQPQVLVERSPKKVVIATLDCKNTSIARKIYRPDNLSKDDYISTLVSRRETLKASSDRVGGDSWKMHTHHLMAQVILIVLLFSCFRLTK